MNAAQKQLLKDAGAKFIRILWCDNANIIRAKAVHTDHLEDCIKNGINITVAQQALPVMHDAVVPESGLGPVGEVRLMPDWSTLTILPYAEKQAQVISDMIVGATRKIWEHCPRGFLRRQIEKLAAQELHLKAVFENEFYLLRRSETGDLVPADDTVFCATGSMNQHAAFVDDLAEALATQGLDVVSYYPESGPGQQEMNIRYTEALNAADNQIIFRETVRGVSIRHGLVASFLPKIFEDKAGSGCHINFSLWREDENVSGDARQTDGISPEAGAFVAGVLDHLTALTAITIPSINSYRRIRPHFWAGAFRAWGYQNREAALRVCKNDAETQAARFEIKTADATTNPYLALGALIAAGLDGMERGLILTEEVAMDPGLMPDEERNDKGIDLLPQDLGEAIEALRKDDVLLNAMGDDLARSFVAVRQKEWEALKGLSLEEEVRLLVERY
ncbi:MAG: glutamine synthetase family protein [Desulfobacterales bacterium]